MRRDHLLALSTLDVAGKSTFLRVLTGDIKLDEGACQIGETVIFGHFEQEPTFPEQKRELPSCASVCVPLAMIEGL